MNKNEITMNKSIFIKKKITEINKWLNKGIFNF